MGHCYFTTFDIASPMEGEVYTGLKPERSLVATALEHKTLRT